MIGRLSVLLLVLGTTSGGQSSPTQAVMSLCDLSRNYGAYRHQEVAVRGVYYYGLRDACKQKCAAGVWPSFLDLVGTSDVVFPELSRTEQAVEREARGSGKRFEIWVTARGQLETMARPSANPCKIPFPGYGHLGAYPAELRVTSFREIKVVENPDSPYDYANMYHGPA